jgi:thiamine-monophosphate kinase
VPRIGARPGDWIYVTGTLGGCLLGRHWRFTPRLAEGAWLARRREVRAMMDVSDGLAKDLYALTPPGASPVLKAAAIPVSPDARRQARRTGRTPLHHALCDGEDYELLLAVAGRADRPAFAQAWRRAFPRRRLSCIGCFVPAGKMPPDALRLEEFHGYEHLQ